MSEVVENALLCEDSEEAETYDELDNALEERLLYDDDETIIEEEEDILNLNDESALEEDEEKNRIDRFTSERTNNLPEKEQTQTFSNNNNAGRGRNYNQGNNKFQNYARRGGMNRGRGFNPRGRGGQFFQNNNRYQYNNTNQYANQPTKCFVNPHFNQNSNNNQWKQNHNNFPKKPIQTVSPWQNPNICNNNIGPPMINRQVSLNYNQNTPPINFGYQHQQQQQSQFLGNILAPVQQQPINVVSRNAFVPMQPQNLMPPPQNNQFPRFIPPPQQVPQIPPMDRQFIPQNQAQPFHQPMYNEMPRNSDYNIPFQNTYNNIVEPRFEAPPSFPNNYNPNVGHQQFQSGYQSQSQPLLSHPVQQPNNFNNGNVQQSYFNPPQRNNFQRPNAILPTPNQWNNVKKPIQERLQPPLRQKRPWVPPNDSQKSQVSAPLKLNDAKNQEILNKQRKTYESANNTNLQVVITTDLKPTELPEEVEEDEETRKYRAKIEEQKRQRARILAQKEENRKLAAQQKLALKEGLLKPEQVTVKPPTLPIIVKTITTKPQINNPNLQQQVKSSGAEAVPAGFLSKRQVISKDEALPDTMVVCVKNLSSCATETQLRKLCNGIGHVQRFDLSSKERQATIEFSSVASAHAFYKKYQRFMLDLSMIQVELITP